RPDDMIISPGQNIAGLEVEAAFLSNEAVLECAVIGAADEERGQIVEAHVALAAAVNMLAYTCSDDGRLSGAPHLPPGAARHIHQHGIECCDFAV
ncbi:MAG: hypothetical protein RLZZ444_351, partial [Pseudomonadota bacterium]